MLIRIVFGVFLVLHGLVHLLYFGQSARMFELQPGLAWPDGSWGLSYLLGTSNTRVVADALCILAGIGFFIGAFGVFFSQSWWRTALVATAAFSAIIFILLWNGRFQQLHNQGAIGILIDAALLVMVLVFRWPQFGF